MTEHKEADWLAVLREQSTPTPTHPERSQSKAAAAIGMSPAVVSQVLKGTYQGRLDRVEAKVRGVFMHQTVVCPALGEISLAKCQDEQGRPFAPTNPQRVAVYKACRSGCPHSRHRRGS